MERWEGREKKKYSERRRMKKHGKNLGTIYKNSQEKRIERDEIRKAKLASRD